MTLLKTNCAHCGYFHGFSKETVENSKNKTYFCRRCGLLNNIVISRTGRRKSKP